ncbi:MAG: DMT family transporter [Porticoccaceae bacterium]|nr:DMT family transporter [Porticoccaceae bacterium]
MHTPPEITAKSWLSISLLGLIWGSTFLVIEIALEGITPFWLAAWRILIAAVLTSVVWGLGGWRLHLSEDRDWRGLLLFGLLSASLPFQLISWGQQSVTSAFAGVSMASVALIILPLAHFFLPNERITPRRLGGFIIGFIGVMVLMGPQLFASTGESAEWLGRIACLLAAGCYASSSIILRRLPPIDAIGVSALPLVIGAVFAITAAFIVEGPPPPVDSKTAVALAVLGLIPTAGANLLRVQVTRTAGPVFMSLTSYQVPLWSVIFGVLLLDEPFDNSLVISLSLILAGVGVSQYHGIKKLLSGSKG